MAISFADATGNLFNRLGRLGKVLSQLRSYQASQQTNLIDTSSGLTMQLASEPDIQATAGNAYQGILNAAGGTVQGTLQGMAESIVNRVVFRDSPRLNQTLASNNTLASLQEIIRQMQVAGATVLQTTVAATASGITGVGNGFVNASVYRALDGRMLENAFAEAIRLTCTADSYVGGATAGNESFTVTGTGIQGDVTAFDWPLGSNARITLAAIDSETDNGNGNLLTNSGWSDWSNNVPSNWTIATGLPGAQVFHETGIVFGGTGALRLLGDGSTAIALTQLFGSSTGTLGTLSAVSQYGLCVYLRRDGVAPAAGVLTLDLIDGNSVVLQDQAGVACSLAIDLTSLTTQYAPYGVAWRTPLVMPDTVYLRLRLSTPLTSGRSVYVDGLSLGVMSQVYTSGPFVSVHSGAVPFNTNDYATVTITNARGSGGSLDTWQTLLARLLYNYIMVNELLLPSSTSPSVSDTLITR